MSLFVTWIPDHWLVLWINVLCHVTAISVAGLVISLCLDHRAVTRYGVLVATLLMCLVSPLASTMLPDLVANSITVAQVLPVEIPTAAHDRPRSLEVSSSDSLPADGTLSKQHSSVRPKSLDDANGDEHPSTPSQSAVSQVFSTGVGKIYVAAAMLFWLVGMVPVLARTLIGYCRLRHILRNAERSWATSDAVMLSGVCREVGLQRIPALLYSNVLSSPIAVGTLRSSVVLPSRISNWIDSEQMRSVLIHEVAHIKRRDPLVAHCQNLAQVIFWAHPLVWIINRHMTRCREAVCDNYVLKWSDGRSYSRTLLRVAEASMQKSLGLLQVGLLTTRAKLEQRISGILQEQRNMMTNSTTRGKALIFVSAVILAGFNLVSVVRLVRADEQPEFPDSVAAGGPSGNHQRPANELLHQSIASAAAWESRYSMQIRVESTIPREGRVDRLENQILLRKDGDKFDLQDYTVVVGQPADYVGNTNNRIVSDGVYFFSRTTSPGHKKLTGAFTIRDRDAMVLRAAEGWLSSRALEGHFSGNEGQSVLEVLAGASNRSHSDETLGTIDCVRISADTEYGGVAVWLDRREDYCLRKATMSKRRRDRYSNLRFGEHIDTAGISELAASVDDIKYTTVAGHRIATSGKITVTTTKDGHRPDTMEIRFVRENIQVNPDFSDTDAFVMDFDEGASITDWDSRIGETNYIWREGKITAAAG